MNATLHTSGLTRWLWPFACLLVLAGYFGSWVAHPTAGLAITGLDLGELVKFLPEIRDGSITVWRQGFYLPLVVVSFTCSMLAYRITYAYHPALRLALLLAGAVAALNLLPPAWTPAILLEPEFRVQTLVLALCLAMIGVSPLLSLLPSAPVYGLLALFCVLTVAVPTQGFLRVLPSIAALYGHALRPAWAYYVCVAGLATLISAYWIGWVREKRSGLAAAGATRTGS